MALEIKGDSTQSVKKSKKSMNRVHFILDESGSMSHARQSTIDGFNEYVNGLRHDKNGNSYKISLTKFEGGNVERVFTDLNIKKVKDLRWEDYCPCGGTNLNDAIGYTMKDMEKNKIKGKHNTLVIILTDGYENQSREWTKATVASLITEKEKKDGWTVTFLGANIDTQAVSRDYAISIDNAVSYTTKGMRGTMERLGTATAAYASNAVVGSSMSNMMCESNTGISTADWMSTDDENEIQMDANTVDEINAALSDLTIVSATGMPVTATSFDIDGGALTKAFQDEEKAKALDALQKSVKDETHSQEYATRIRNMKREKKDNG